MSKSSILTFLVIAAALGIGGFIAFSDPADGGGAPSGEEVTRRGSNLPVPPRGANERPTRTNPSRAGNGTPARGNTPTGGNGATSAVGNPGVADVTQPVDPEIDPDDLIEVDPVLEALEQIVEIEDPGKQRLALVRLLPKLRKDMNDERADALLSSVSLIEDEQTRSVLISQIISYEPIYRHEKIREELRKEEAHNLRSKLSYTEAKIADDSARQWMTETFLEGGDPTRGVTVLARVIPVLIVSGEKDGDAEVIEMLRKMDTILKSSGTVKLKDLVWQKLQTLEGDRLKRYQEIFDSF